MNDAVKLSDSWGPFEVEPGGGWWTIDGAAAMGQEVKRNTFRRSVLERARERFGSQKRNAKRPRDAAFELAFHEYWLQHISQPSELPLTQRYSRRGKSRYSFIDLTGLRFGMLVAETRVKRNGTAMWNCRCDCGTMFDVRAAHLRNGNNRSCGCLGRARAPVELTRELVWELFDYDPATGDLIYKRRARRHFSTDRLWRDWNAEHAGKPAGWRHNGGRGYLAVDIPGSRKKYLVHRLIVLLVTGRLPGFKEVAHENHDGMDNRWDNLCERTHRQNLKNQDGIRKNNTSGYLGVRPSPTVRKWTARITAIDGSDLYIGTYDTIEEAAAARRDAEREHGYHDGHGKKLI